MKLSEAIRLGAMMRPQAFGVLYDRHTGGSCALGAAAEAIGVGVYPDGYVDNHREKARRLLNIGGLPLTHTTCPACSAFIGDQICHVIIHLNNDHRWTRERIADWVAALESSETPNGADGSRAWGAVATPVVEPVAVNSRLQ